MIETAPTLGSVETTTRQKKQLAHQSLDHNVKDPTFRKLFPNYVEKYAQEMAARGESAETDDGAAGTLPTSEAALLRRGRIGEALEIQGLTAMAAGLFAILSIVVAAMRFI